MDILSPYGKGNGINKKYIVIIDGPEADGSTFSLYNVYLKNGNSYKKATTIKEGNSLELELQDEPTQLSLAFDLVYDNGVKTEKKEFSVYIPVECITSVSATQNNNEINLSWEVDETKKNIKETTFKEFRIYKDKELIGSTTENHLPITSEKELVANLRAQLEKLNDYRFTDREWTAFFKEKIANQNNGIVEKTAIVQEDHIQLLTREDGSTKNIYLLDKKDIHNNYLQVINQYVPEGGSHENRYDVTILVNGLPLAA